jgi:BirA family transcriptional regulator, biotin operon repressor / biotin---[acetyl-CoA-carboxylase] ligase
METVTNSGAIARELGQISDIRDQISAIEVFEEIGSTNELLWERYRTQASMPRVAIAKQQTAGRGQWGRTWTSPLGGLYLSMLLPVEIEPENAYILTLASVWGITEQLNRAGVPVQIKWANDLLLQGQKLGGIKTETKITSKATTKITAAVVGVGINYSNPVPDVGINLENFWRANPDIAAPFLGDRLAALIIAGILIGIAQIKKNTYQSIIPQYLKHLKNLNELIIYEGHLGQIIGVNEKGELLVKMTAAGATSTIKIPPGQISLGYGQSKDNQKQK